METSNPTFNEKLIKRVSALEATDHMTVSGTIAKTTLLLGLLLASASFAWQLTESNPSSALALVIGSSIAGFILALIIIFTKPSPFLVVLYALLQGLVMGGISYLFNAEWQSIVFQAVVLTISIFSAMLVLYATRIINVTEKLKSGIILATFGVLIFYIVTWIIGLFSPSFYMATISGTTGVIIAGVIVFIAALNLLLDFSFIEEGANKKLPKQMEWYGAFGLMVTLIWLYISILRLLAASRN